MTIISKILGQEQDRTQATSFGNSIPVGENRDTVEGTGKRK